MRPFPSTETITSPCFRPAFAAGLSHLIHDPELRNDLGRRGFEFVAGKYSRERLLSDIKALYKQLEEHKAIKQCLAQVSDPVGAEELIRMALKVLA